MTCTEFAGEFVAEKLIVARKVVRCTRQSVWAPTQRSTVRSWASAGKGKVLRYPIGEVVESPSGPGIYCYYSEHLTNGELRTLSPGSRVILVEIPVGALVRWAEKTARADKVQQVVSFMVYATSQVRVLT